MTEDPTLSDEDFLAALRNLTLPAESFKHRDHIRLAYCCLARMEFTDALHRIKTDIKRFAEALGAAQKYHETITIALVSLIQERMARVDCGSYEAFIDKNPDLLSK